jgi:hypothetical protein
MDHHTEFLSADQFRYEAERDVYLCLADKELRFFPAHSRCAFPSVSSSRQGLQSLSTSSAQCTTSTRGHSLCRSVDKACLERMCTYQPTAAYIKALRKRQVWVDPLCAEGKDWHDMRRFLLRRQWRVNCEALMRAAEQHLKRLLQKHGWGRRPCPAEAVYAFFFATC